MHTVDWDREVLRILREHGAGTQADLVPWQPVADCWRGLAPVEAEALGQRLLAMLDFDYRNAHSEDPYVGDGMELLPLPAGMKPDDLLCLEAAAYAVSAAGLPGARERLQALLRAPRFHAVYPHLRSLHRDITDLLRTLDP